MTQATPRPWWVGDTGMKVRGNDAYDVAVTSRSCAPGHGVSFPIDDEAKKANAELIVRAVNDHDELVSLLTQAVDCRKCHEYPDEDWLERARSALERARG